MKGNGRKKAIFVNDTSQSYHWGCYATSMAIKHGLEDAGYDVTSFPVEVTHTGLGVAPEGVDDLSAFSAQLPTSAPALWAALQGCDLVVVNGEGTLHRFHAGPRSLLALLWTAKREGKPVHLINHSLFPSGSKLEAPQNVEEYYRACLEGVERIVVRENHSKLVYNRLGIDAILGFDCLPLFSEGLRLPNVPESIMLCGASNWSSDEAEEVGQTLSGVLKKSTPVVFLSGGPISPPEDKMHFESLRKGFPDLEFAEPENVERWLSLIAHAKLVVTGRFHHLIAAISLSAPVVMMPGNTSKSDAVCQFLGIDLPLVSNDRTLVDRVASALDRPVRTSEADLMLVRALASRNVAF